MNPFTRTITKKHRSSHKTSKRHIQSTNQPDSHHITHHASITHSRQTHPRESHVTCPAYYVHKDRPRRRKARTHTHQTFTHRSRRLWKITFRIGNGRIKAVADERRHAEKTRRVPRNGCFLILVGTFRRISVQIFESRIERSYSESVLCASTARAWWVPR